MCVDYGVESACANRAGLCAKGLTYRDNACRDPSGRPIGPAGDRSAKTAAPGTGANANPQQEQSQEAEQTCWRSRISGGAIVRVTVELVTDTFRTKPRAAASE